MACDEIDIEIGRRLRQARVAAGLTQTELGVRLGISFQQIQKYEKGRNRIGGGRLYKIARILGVKITYFFDGVEHLLDADAVPAGTNELAAIDNRTIRAAHVLANLPDEDIKEQVFRLIAALPKQKASR
ncbi:MAG: helix-turn-helix transcriptional regulator [Proteobacteria bacterium]|nr:helix-turn-helix transcriptional regulator [Pseudomonadota bacterium]